MGKGGGLLWDLFFGVTGGLAGGYLFDLLNISLGGIIGQLVTASSFGKFFSRKKGVTPKDYRRNRAGC